MIQEIQEIEKEAHGHLAQAKSFQIIDQQSYEDAAGRKKALSEFKKRVLEVFDPIVKKSHAAWKEAVAQRDKHVNPVEECETIYRDKAKAYEREQQRIQEEAQRKAREEAERQAKLERERIEKEAEKALDKGDLKQAESLLNQSETVIPEVSIIPPSINRVKGLGIRTVWKFRIVDVKKIPLEYMIPDEVKIGKVVRALNKETNIPGIEVYEE